MNVLIISAHPDDEVIGAGGTIARHVAEGDKVYWCIVTQGASDERLLISRQQVFSVKEILGITELFFCGFPTVRLNTVPYIEVCTALQNIVDVVKPMTVYTTPRDDINQDHRIVHDCTLVATRPLPGCSVIRLLSYEITTTTRFGLPHGANGFYPNVFVDISNFLAKKLEAMSCYHSQLRIYPHPRSLQSIELFARERGISVCVEAAECFQLHRELIKY